MINLQIICDKCGKDTGVLTLVDYSKSIKHQCIEAGYIADVKEKWFDPGYDLCCDCLSMHRTKSIVEGE